MRYIDSTKADRIYRPTLAGPLSIFETVVSRVSALASAIISFALILSPLHPAQAALTDRAAVTAPIHFENLKFDKVAASGVCMALRVSSPTEVDYWLQRYDIKAPAARQTERAAIASGLSQI